MDRHPRRPATTPSPTTTTYIRTPRSTGPASGARPDMSFFSYDFMIRALIGAMVTGLTAPAIGVYLVQRRLSLIGDGLGHVALTGVGLGLLTSTSPVLMAGVGAPPRAGAREPGRARGRAG